MTLETVMADWRADIIPAASLSEDLCSEWNSFLESDPLLANPFYSPGFVRAVACVRPHVYVAALQRQSRNQGFFPFQFAGPWHRRLGAAERVGGELSDYFGLIAAN